MAIVSLTNPATSVDTNALPPLRFTGGVVVKMEGLWGSASLVRQGHDHNCPIGETHTQLGPVHASYFQNLLTDECAEGVTRTGLWKCDSRDRSSDYGRWLQAAQVGTVEVQLDIVHDEAHGIHWFANQELQVWREVSHEGSGLA
jgi:hypothetical protein